MPRAFVLLISAAAALAPTACGGSSSSSSSSTGSSSAPASTPTQPSGSPSGSSIGADPGGQLKFTKSSLSAKAGKVAIRFLDGEVLRGHLDGTLERHRYGVVLHLHAEHSDSPVRKLGIPFSAVKALFFVREFDARGEEAGTASEAYLARRTMAPLLDVLEEMDMLTRLHRDGLLSDTEYASKRTMVLERVSRA